MKCFKKVTLSGDLTDKNKTWTTYFTSSDHHHGMYSDICSDIMSEYFWHIFWQSIWRDFYLTFYVAFKLAFYLTFLSEIEPGKLSCIKMAFCLTHFLTCSLAYFPACLRMPEVSRFHERCDSSSFFLLVPSSFSFTLFFLLLPSSSFLFLLVPSSSFFFLLLPSSSSSSFEPLENSSAMRTLVASSSSVCARTAPNPTASSESGWGRTDPRLGTHGPERMPKKMSEYCLCVCVSGRMQNRQSKNMADRMPARMPDRMSTGRMPDRVPNRCQEICQVECHIDCPNLCQIKCQLSVGGDH